VTNQTLQSRVRASEGRERAKAARGVKMGRKPTLTHHQQLEAIKRVNAARRHRARLRARTT
jgi:hypothetical protein